MLEPLIGDAVRCRDALTEGVVTGADVWKNTHKAMHQQPGYTEIQNLGKRKRVATYPIEAQRKR